MTDNKAQLIGLAIWGCIVFTAYKVLSPILGEEITALLGLPAFLFIPACHRMAKTLFPDQPNEDEKDES